MLPRSGLTHGHLAGGHPRAGDEPHAPALVELLVEHREHALALGRRLHRTQRVVLAAGGDAEDGHDGVADDLLDDPAVRFEHDLHLVEVARQDLAQRLRVELLPEGGGALQVRGDDRGNSPDLLGGPVLGERRSALAAER